MPSPLSFDATENFRNRLLIKNLKPDPYELRIKFPGNPADGPFQIPDLAVVNPGNVEELGQIEEIKLYKKNKYGPENNDGAYGNTVDFFQPIQDTSNQGQYQYFTSEPSLSTEESQERLFLQNFYGPQEGFIDLIDLSDVHQVVNNRDLYYKFIFSNYSPLSILVDNDPEGNNGSLSQDSNLARIGATQLKEEFLNRIAQETYQETLGRINALDALDDPFRLLGIARGREGVIERNYRISVPDTIVGKGLNFISRISGVYVPYSWIPGDFFALEDRQSFINQAVNAVTGLFDRNGRLELPTTKTGYDIFLQNTGAGQQQQLSGSLRLNRYIPDYKLNFIGEPNLLFPNPNYYIGSRTQEVSSVVSPADELPLNQDGSKSQSPVKGYGEIAKIYEGENNFKFGLNSSSFYDKFNSLGGGFSWITNNSPLFEKQGKDGEIYTDSVSREESMIWDFGTQSDSYTFTKGSILYNTQELVNAAENLQGVKKLQHVGTAINQVSKVFFDGNREITKGSRVLKYVDENNQIVGKEYCRLFTKDRPYFYMGNLQKTDGITNANRRFGYSVLDNTFNLNITPNKGEDSTNLTNTNVKKYMFSIENLAWRTSSKKGFTYDDLPLCERGPNGGRIMWFPPYDINFSETNAANWTDNVFLGRPEPIYTYNNTTRTGTLNWSIVVDHPSVLNAIVDKELSKESDNNKVNQIVDSFFAGCRKYDIYELATRFPQFTYKDLYDIVTKTENIQEFAGYENELRPIVENKVVEEIPEPTQQTFITESDYENITFYFDNDIPTSVVNYEETIEAYTNRKQTYINYNGEQNSTGISNFFDNYLVEYQEKVNPLISKVLESLQNDNKVTIKMKGSASNINSQEYNQALSQRRVSSVLQYLTSIVIDDYSIEDYIDKLDLVQTATGFDNIVTLNGVEYDCNEPFENNTEAEYSLRAIACRSVSFDVILEEVKEVTTTDQNYEVEPQEETEIRYEVVSGSTTPIYNNKVKKTQNLERKENVAKIVVRKLLNECDYFQTIKEENPLIYDGIKEKIKYFNPTFHSTTPEGLNSRLTFLQQCIRPGDTIPVLDENGDPKNDNANNTAFGAPPICVLRIGDFYHTKIAITQIGISYEPLTFDLNPEGIGVQPMIAKINMSFNFIGGQGLKEPVSRLQNALSFNYYGNTEVYDDRSVVTDVESNNEINASIIEDIENLTEFGLGDLRGQENAEEGGSTIGEIVESNIIEVNSAQTITGKLSYTKVINDLVTKSKTYVDSLVSFFDNINSQQSEIMMYYAVNERKYTTGQITNYFDAPNATTINIFGNPTRQQDLIQTLIEDLIDDVDNDVSPLLKNISIQNFTNSEKKKYKKNIKNLIENQKNILLDVFSSTVSEVINNELDMISTIDKINLVLTDTDGYKNKSNDVFIYALTATTETDPTSTGSPSDTREELINDINLIGENLQAVFDSIFLGGGNSLLDPTKTSVYEGFFTGENNTPQYTRFATAFFDKVLKSPESIKDVVLSGGLSQKTNWTNYVNTIIYGQPEIPNDPLILGSETSNQPLLAAGQKGLQDYYKELLAQGGQKISKLKNSESVKIFNNYAPFNDNKQRLFSFIKQGKTSLDEQKVEYFNTTYQQQNDNNQTRFNLRNSFN